MLSNAGVRVCIHRVSAASRVPTQHMYVLHMQMEPPQNKTKTSAELKACPASLRNVKGIAGIILIWLHQGICSFQKAKWL